MVRKLTPTAGGWSKRAHSTHQHRAFEQSARRTLAASPYSTQAWRDDLARRILDHVRALPPTIADAMRTAVTDIIELETRQLQIPDTTHDDSLQAVADRARLRALLTFQEQSDRLIAGWIDGLGAIFRTIADAAPENPSADNASFATVPLISLLRRPAVELVTQIVTDLLRFSNDDPHAVAIGAATARTVKDALLNISKINDDAARKNPHRLVSPAASGLTGEALVKAFLPPPFQTLLSMPVPFQIPRKKWASHGIGLAPPDFGKSQLLGTIMWTLINEPDPPSIVLFDPHGDLFSSVLALDVFHPEHGRLRHKLVILDAADPRGPPPFNFIATGSTTETGAQQTFAYLLSSFSSDWTPKQATVATYLLKLLRTLPDASLDTLRRLLDDPAKSASTSEFSDAFQALPAFERDYFLNHFFEARMRETKQSMGWKIYNVMGNPRFRDMFSATHSCIDASAMIAEKKIVLVNGGNTILGDEGMPIFLQFILGQFYAAALTRDAIPADERHLCLLLIDEASHVFKSSPHITRILTETRKYGLGMFALTQLAEHMSTEVKAAIYGATAIRFAGAVQSADATAFAREMYCDADFIRSMQAVERSHCEWAVQIAGITNNQAIRLKVPYGALARAPQMSKADIERVRDLNYQRLTAAAPQPTTAIINAPTHPPAPVSLPPRDFGKVETVTVLGITLPALLDTGAEVSAIIATERHHCGTPEKPRLSFTIATRQGSHTFERPVIGSVECPVIALDITLDDYTALEHFAVTVDPVHQSQPIILGGSFFAAAPFAVRISPADSMLGLQRRQNKRPHTRWDSDHGEADEV